MFGGGWEAGGEIGVRAGLHGFVEGAGEDFGQADGAGAGGLGLWRLRSGGWGARVCGRGHGGWSMLGMTSIRVAPMFRHCLRLGVRALHALASAR